MPLIIYKIIVSLSLVQNVLRLQCWQVLSRFTCHAMLGWVLYVLCQTGFGIPAVLQSRPAWRAAGCFNQKVSEIVHSTFFIAPQRVENWELPLCRVYSFLEIVELGTIMPILFWFGIIICFFWYLYFIPPQSSQHRIIFYYVFACLKLFLATLG